MTVEEFEKLWHEITDGRVFTDNELAFGRRVLAQAALDAVLDAPLYSTRQDAARYRWLKANVHSGSLGVPGGWIGSDTDEWDASIDASLR